jgi:formamidase
VEELAPVSVIGTAGNMNSAIDNGLQRAATHARHDSAGGPQPGDRDGAIEIGRAPGVIQVTFLAPLRRLDAVGLGTYAREQYNL